MNKKIIPIFFASDDRYAPCLAVAIRSLSEHASPSFTYRVYVLIDQLEEANKERLSSLQTKNLTIEFVNVSKKLDAIGGMMHLRDYYTKATYYRFFIPELFPQYQKGLYLDCDIVVLGDISELYRVELGSNLCAATPEEVMNKVDIFGRYVEVCLGVGREDYFSAGVLLMNLAEMRRCRIEQTFVDLLGKVKYRVTQDQDYLNVICRNRVRLLGYEWNQTACPGWGDEGALPEIAHFKINWKPWHYEGVAFEDYFWAYAEQTPFYPILRDMLASYTEEERQRDARQYVSLEALAASEIRDKLAADGVQSDDGVHTVPADAPTLSFHVTEEPQPAEETLCGEGV